ncbi:MAG: glycerol-3-phosphate responsive antiterminator [Tissierellaceae bacterium]
MTFFERVNKNPIISSIKKLDDLELALDSPCEIIFLNTGNIFNLKEISHRVRERDKDLYIHVESIDGFSRDTWGLEYIVKNIHPNGIITGKTDLVKLSKDMGIFTIQRIIVSDSHSLQESIASIRKIRPSAVEVLPGIMSDIIEKIIRETKISVIASGLITDKSHLVSSLNAGSVAISSSSKDIWYS